MPRTVATGIQDFEKLRNSDVFCVDKTLFIKDWWDSKDDVTLITRPRRFGKTLNISMLECFFSIRYAGRSEMFEDMNIWKHEEMRDLQGTYPVISLSLAKFKETNFSEFRNHLCGYLAGVFMKYEDVVMKSEVLSETYKNRFKYFINIHEKCIDNSVLVDSINLLADILSHHYGKNVIILLDEYDTPMVEAWVSGYWDEMIAFMRLFFNSTFKNNEYLYRAVMTGITRVSKESLFSDLNNLKICTLSSRLYQQYFGFTEEEVFAAMDEYGYTNKDEVKFWYDGFTIGEQKDVYNPWSVINFLSENRLKPYWANTSSNALVSKLIREGDPDLKMDFEILLDGGSVRKKIDEEMVFSQLGKKRDAVWSLLAMSGYLRIDSIDGDFYSLSVVNYEVMKMFSDLIYDWFDENNNYSDFIKALLQDDIDYMNEFMNRITVSMFSTFDTGNKPSEKAEPERFYHGFVLGLIVDLKDRYAVTSNRESGFGRYDVMLEPKDKSLDDAMIFEFKVLNKRKGENTLEDCVRNALKQIEEKKYVQILIDKGIPAERIRKYGFAFEGENVLIGQ